MFISSKKAAAILGVKESTLRHWRAQDPSRLTFYKMGWAVRYKEQDVIDYIESGRDGGD